jgi:hypothetical protein
LSDAKTALWQLENEHGELKGMYAANIERFGWAAMFTALLTGGTLFLTGLADAADHIPARDLVLMLGGVSIPALLWIIWQINKPKLAQVRVQSPSEAPTPKVLTPFFFTVLLAASIAMITFFVNGLIEMGWIHHGWGAGIVMLATAVMWGGFVVVVYFRYLRPNIK